MLTFQELGTREVQGLNGKAAFTCRFKRSLKAKTFAFPSTVKVTAEQTIYPALPCQRVLVVSQSGVIVALVEGKDGQFLHSLRSSVLARNVISFKAFVKPEKLPPTSCAMKYHSLRNYLQVMTWMKNEEAMDATDWGWCFVDTKNILLTVMTEQDTAPHNLLKIIHYQCTTAYLTMRSSCRKYGLACSNPCGSCQL